MANFRGERWFLSNFSPATVLVGHQREPKDIELPTVEHGFVWYKTVVPAERLLVGMCATPAEAKRLGRTLTVRTGWPTLRNMVMLHLLRQKFDPARHPDLAAKLTATGDEELVEVNEWGDTYWGVCDGVGENRLGRLLMMVRAELR